jgi:hypothetical protein
VADGVASGEGDGLDVGSSGSADPEGWANVASGVDPGVGTTVAGGGTVLSQAVKTHVDSRIDTKSPPDLCRTIK